MTIFKKKYQVVKVSPGGSFGVSQQAMERYKWASMWGKVASKFWFNILSLTSTILSLTYLHLSLTCSLTPFLHSITYVF